MNTNGTINCVNKLKIYSSNPALKIVNFTSFASKVFKALNSVRTDPRSFIKKIENLLKDFDNEENVLHINNFGMRIVEGEPVFVEAIDLLSKCESLLPVSLSPGITKSAEDLMNVLILHDGIPELGERTKYNLERRLNNHGEAFGEIDEVIDYGMFDPEMIVINFILGDGDKSRSERNIIFNQRIKFCGIASNILPSEKVCTVINFAENFYLPGEEYYQKNTHKYGKNTITRQTGWLDSLNKKGSAEVYDEKVTRFRAQTKTKTSGEENKTGNSDIIFRNGSFSNQPNDKSPLTLTEINSDHGSDKKVTGDNITNQQPSTDFGDLPEGVDKIDYKEKKVKNSKTGLEEIIVKKTIVYSNGHIEESIYKK